MFTGLPNLSLMSSALRRGGGAAFDPLSLDPVWMADFSDTDTMYLTSDGVTKVASDGATVGTLLEVSQWDGGAYASIMTAQPELVSNPGFDGGSLSGWAAAYEAGYGTFTAAAGGGKITVSGAGGVTRRPRWVATLTGISSGKLLAIRTINVERAASEMGIVHTTASTGTGGSTLSYNLLAGANEFKNFATASSMYLAIFVGGSGDGQYGIFDDVSAKVIPGTHQQQTTVAARPKWYSPNILRCDGTDDALPGLPAPSASGTIALKMKATTANRVAMGCQNATPNRCYLGTDSSGQLAGAIGSDGFATIHGSTDIVTSPVTGVAILTWDATGGVQLYWEGTQVYTGALSGSIPTATTMTLGGLNNNGTPASYFAGDVIGTPIVLDSYANAATAAQLTTYLNS